VTGDRAEATFATEPLWRPSADRATASQLAGFAAGVGLDPDFAAIHSWSVAHAPAFWREVWERCGMVGEPGEVVVDEARPDEMWATRFFPDARLNVVDTILSGRGAADEDVALVSRDELGRRRTWTRGALRADVAAVAAAFRDEGVGPGDRVAAWLPNIAEALILMLGAAAVGATFSSTSPDFGVDGVVDRFGQIRPTVLVAVDGYFYGGKQLDCLERLAEIRAALPSVRRAVLVGNLDWDGGSPAVPAGATAWDEWLAPHRGTELRTQPLPFDHPWYVLYSSGTTGVPKCIVHRAGGVLLQHLKEHQLHCDIRPGDRVFYYTTCGWMMWNWLASVPASGATAVLYDGSPFHPSERALIDLAKEEGLSLLGVSAKYLDSLRKSSLAAGDFEGLDDLRTITSTGSPLPAETFAWVYDTMKADVHLSSMSGGTDLCGCLVGGDPTSPVYAGEIQRPALGMAIEVWDDAGATLGPGERGDLVCTRSFPSMPLGFWGDDDGTRFRSAYFETFPGVWAQGDFAMWTPHGGIVITGRSDTTLNPGGVRIGTGEIYRQVEQIPEVVESLVFGQDWDGDTRIVLLVRLADGVTLDDALVADVKARIRTGCTPRHVPAVVAAVEDLPRTRSGKLAELAVADAVNGREVRNTSALANPEALDHIRSVLAAIS
jgi:acetoacetyl-CoA synthetase